MQTLILEIEPVAMDVSFEDTGFRVALEDGQELTVPLAWFPRLLHGEGLRWEALDEDISVAGLFAGCRNQTRSPSLSQAV